jgi:hypothetical protein
MVACIRQNTAFGPGRYRGYVFDRQLLQKFVDGTNKAISVGIPIPLLKRHAPINASDFETAQFAKEEGVGWITKVGIDEDTGAIYWEAKDVPDDVAKQIKEGTVRFTSPEFRLNYASEKDGVYSGPIIRHFAFTPKPGNPHQGNIELVGCNQMSEYAWQFAETDRELLPDYSPSDKECAEIVKQAETWLTEQDKELSKDVNPGNWIADEKTWEKAKKIVEKSGYKGDSKWAVTTYIYRKMGGKVKNSAQFEKGSPEGYKEAGGESGGGHGSPPLKVKLPDEHQKEPAMAGHTQHEENPLEFPGDKEKASSEKIRKLIIFLAQKGIVLPEGFCLNDESAVDILLAAVSSSLKTEMAVKDSAPVTVVAQPPPQPQTAAGVSDPEDQDEEEEEKVNRADVKEAPIPFSEIEKTLPEEVKKYIQELQKANEEAKSKVLQYEEERRQALNKAAKEEAKLKIQQLKIPPALKNKLLKDYDTDAIQFSEGKEEPKYTALDVANIVASCIPPHLQFSTEEVELAETPKANTIIGQGPDGKPVLSEPTSEQFFEKGSLQYATLHVDPQRAEEIVARSPFRFLQPVEKGAMLSPPTPMK